MQIRTDYTGRDKRRLSPEGYARIVAANRARAERQRAAKSAAVPVLQPTPEEERLGPSAGAPPVMVGHRCRLACAMRQRYFDVLVSALEKLPSYMSNTSLCDRIERVIASCAAAEALAQAEEPEEAAP